MIAPVTSESGLMPSLLQSGMRTLCGECTRNSPRNLVFQPRSSTVFLPCMMRSANGWQTDRHFMAV